MFFSIAPSRAELSDINSGLINAYKEVAQNAEKLIRELRRIPVDSDTYYKVRSKKPRSAFKQALRFIYLNRTCYGGLHRENKSGEFNVPFGGGDRTPRILWEGDLLARASHLLLREDVIVQEADFRTTIAKSVRGDVVYCDPVYRRANGHSFDRYGPKLFGWEDQVDLAKLSREAQSRGVLVIVSNAYCERVSEIYYGAQEYVLLKSKTIGNRPNHNDSHKEVLLIFEPYGRVNFEWNTVISRHLFRNSRLGGARRRDISAMEVGQLKEL